MLLGAETSNKLASLIELPAGQRWMGNPFFGSKAMNAELKQDEGQLWTRWFGDAIPSLNRRPGAA
jgi:hypothetical protein